MNKKMLCAIFMASLILSLHFLSDIIVYARENSGFKEEKAKLLPLSESETASEHICEPEADAQQEICETANAPVTEYDKNFKLEILDRDTCTKITLEDYLIMVVMSEMPYTFESEALRAQAVAARTYTLKQLEDGTRHEKNTVCSDPAHCSAGLNKHEYIEKYGTEAYEKAYTAVYDAVISTDGVVIKYNDELCTAVYHSASIGATENSYNLWGTYTPYLLSVDTPETIKAQTVSIDTDSFIRSLPLSGADVSDISVNYNDTGRCESIDIGKNKINAIKIRSLFGLRSSDFNIDLTEDKIIFTVYGYGHGIGMSQYGANEMAKSGADYKEILRHYYTGVEILRN